MMIDQVDAALDWIGHHLADKLLSGYTDGLEDALARGAVDGLTQDQRPEVLAWLIHSAVMDITVGRLNILNEGDDDSYQLIEEISGKLVEAVRRQGSEESLLLHLITEEICERARFDNATRTSTPT